MNENSEYPYHLFSYEEHHTLFFGWHKEKLSPSDS